MGNLLYALIVLSRVIWLEKKVDYNFYREFVRKPRAAYNPLCGHPCYRLFTVIQIWISANVTFLKIGNFELREWNRMHTVISCLLNPNRGVRRTETELSRGSVI